MAFTRDAMCRRCVPHAVDVSSCNSLSYYRLLTADESTSNRFSVREWNHVEQAQILLVSGFHLIPGINIVAWK